ncbi:MAG: acetyl-CoA carboxylase biotin carboxyl carrier protein [Drouetiella hepatica Uher 2000/2452]|uniref:Biotin carboxyl carrier protein of acetyl-CoA carboxylase n=1 Tax=Drouetiella hepatica Uher 2000/2452 TaxID=904376 RepID=A0A951UN52_9CYAN|nr:acetyl-CoA carboxylase biotin carboxyl carrier protein [Drouetiella hepatica Uher 2000/2452]
MELDFNELRELLTVINQTDIAEFTLKSGEFELMVRKGAPLETYVPPANGSSGAVPPPSPASLPNIVASPPPSASPRANEKLLTVTAPMVGTFYRSPAPDEPPFVDMGDRIRPGQTVCIIEAMKLMNELESEVAGEIVEILAKNGDPVEYGQVLMRVNPG